MFIYILCSFEGFIAKKCIFFSKLSLIEKRKNGFYVYNVCFYSIVMVNQLSFFGCSMQYSAHIVLAPNEHMELVTRPSVVRLPSVVHTQDKQNPAKFTSCAYIHLIKVHEYYLHAKRHPHNCPRYCDMCQLCNRVNINLDL